MFRMAAALRIAADRFDGLVAVVLPKPDKRAGLIGDVSSPLDDLLRDFDKGVWLGAARGEG